MGQLMAELRTSPYLASQPEVAMPAPEKMVSHEGSGGDHHEGAAYPQSVGCAPQALAQSLGVASDAHDPCLVEVLLRLVYRCHLCSACRQLLMSSLART